MTSFRRSFLAEILRYILFTSEWRLQQGFILQKTNEVSLFLLRMSAVTTPGLTLLKPLFWLNDDNNAFCSAETQSMLTP